MTDQLTVQDLMAALGQERAENYRKEKVITRLTRELAESKRQLTSIVTSTEEETDGKVSE